MWLLVFKKKIGWDDALGVWGVHGIGGFTGTILIGILADKTVNGVCCKWSSILDPSWWRYLSCCLFVLQLPLSYLRF